MDDPYINECIRKTGWSCQSGCSRTCVLLKQQGVSKTAIDKETMFCFYVHSLLDFSNSSLFPIEKQYQIPVNFFVKLLKKYLWGCNIYFFMSKTGNTEVMRIQFFSPYLSSSAPFSAHYPPLKLSHFFAYAFAFQFFAPFQLIFTPRLSFKLM